jgi:hypothetical protein
MVEVWDSSHRRISERDRASRFVARGRQSCPTLPADGFVEGA